MARRRSLAVAALALVAALAVPGVLLARAARADVAVLLVAPPQATFQALLARGGSSGRIELALDPYRSGGDVRYFVRVLVAMNRPTTSFVLELRDEDGGRLARCSFGPAGYRVDRHTQTALLACPVPAPERLGSALLEATAPDAAAALAVRRRGDGRYQAGGLLIGQPKGIRAALERLSVARPRALGAPTLLAALGLSAGLLAAALALATERGGGGGRRRPG